MATAKITLRGMAKYLDMNNDDLFAAMVLPANIDKSTLVDSIMLRGAEFEVLYADADTMKYAIGAWSKKWQKTLTRWADALDIEYNPLENYDRREDWLDSRERKEKNRRSDSGMAWNAGFTEDDNTTDNNKYAFDSSNASPESQSISNGSTWAQNATQNFNQGNAETSGNDDSLHTGRVHGNIGVTTSQKMLSDQWEVAMLSVYEAAADLFLTELTIYTY